MEGGVLMVEYENFEEEMYDDEIEASYKDEAEDDEVNPKEEAFLRGYEEADNIDEDVEWEFDEDSDEEE